MYKILGLRVLLHAFTWTSVALAALVAGGSLLIEVPSGWKWVQFALTAISSGIATAMFLFGILGETRLFPWCCRRKWACGAFPDLDGEWYGELRSNWPRIAARGDDKVGEIELLVRPAKVRLRAALFTVSMSLEADDLYSTSKTILAIVNKDSVTGEFSLAYVFENRTVNPTSSDVSSHLGAAILTLRREGDDLTLSGPYWTNRAWNLGRNTAGLAKFRKRQ